jgi:hypothetical protein
MIITLPSAPIAQKIDWNFEQPAQSTRGEFTKKRRVTLLPFAPRFSASVTLPPIVGERNVEAWRAFLVDLDGIANSFRLIACEADQITGVAPLVKGAGQAGFSLRSDGWGPAGLKLRRGQFVTINDELKVLMAPVIADATGNAELNFKPYLRTAPADNMPLVVTRPYGLMSMVDPKNGWSAGIGKNYAVSFQCEEAF